MQGNHVILNRMFSKSIFDDLVENNNNKIYSAVVKSCLGNVTGQKNRDVIEQLYQYMSKRYRNEYIYKNTLINKILLGKHSINTTTAITQLPVGNAKADLVMINGKAVVYEIKTELDSFYRLETQICNYYKVFNHVCVVSSNSHKDSLLKMLKNTPVGIYILSPRNTIQYIEYFG